MRRWRRPRGRAAAASRLGWLRGCLAFGSTVDFIISEDGSYKSFGDFGRLRRLDGGDDFFRRKHKVYREVEPLLKLID
jgi:hypothetical protein